MTLDIHLLGAGALRQLQHDPAAEPDFALLIGTCLQLFPEQIAGLTVDEVPEVVDGGFRVGDWRDLHLLRGLALASEQLPTGELASLSEADLEARIEAFYAQADQATAFPHLIHHADDSGFYLPFALEQPFSFEGLAPGDDPAREGEVTVSVASSLGLLQELDRLNAVLALPGDVGELGDEDAFIALAEAHRWPTVAWVWGVLHLFARLSVQGSSFIKFG